jgi:hypothetical protein
MARRVRSACGPFMKEVASDRADRFCDFAFVHAEAPSGRFVCGLRMCSPSRAASISWAVKI